MSRADVIFVENMKDILENGMSTEGLGNRAKWDDGSEAWTKKVFGRCNRYKVAEEFPALTLRKTALKSAMDEILWIYQKKSNKVADLKSNIWDEWIDENGTIGAAYGAQVAKRDYRMKIPMEKYTIALKEELRSGDYPSVFICENPAENLVWVAMDQMDAVIWDLKHNPFSRRIMISLWNVSELIDMNLEPCCWNVTFNVTINPETGKKVLNMALNQRSADMLTANNWNVTQYALLQMMLAQVCDMEVGELMHTIVDMHCYNKHFEMVEELITREQFPAPKVRLNPEVKNFYDFTTDDLIVEDYQAGPQLKIPVAI